MLNSPQLVDCQIEENGLASIFTAETIPGVTKLQVVTRKQDMTKKKYRKFAIRYINIYLSIDSGL